MNEIPNDLHDAGPILAGLLELCQERAAVTKNGYLTASEQDKINGVLTALNYHNSDNGVATEWRNSLIRCLFGSR